MEKLTLEKLEKTLWDAADILRGELNAAQYMDYIFGLLFLKRMNDQFELEQAEKKEEFEQMGLPEEDINILIKESNIYENFYLPERARWKNIKDLTINIGPELDKAFKDIEDEPKNSELIGVLTTANYNDKERVSDKKLSQLLILFSGINLASKNLESKDVLGNAYEYMIKQFADQGGTKGGEFYTPEQVVKTLVGIVKPKEGEKIYDPTTGSGGMLIHSTYYIENHGGNPKNVSLNGQEINLSTWAICKMNMLFHDATGAVIKKGDTIRDPKHTKGGVLETFDVVLANPPFSLKNWGMDEAKADAYGRFVYGIPPKSYGDLAFVEHMIASLNSKGRMATVLPHGVLFRGSSEGKIRTAILKDDLIEAVIGLPQNIFYGTGIPAAILVINKDKSEDRKNKVLFIDASQGFVKDGNKNKLRDEDIEKIVSTFDAFESVEKYAEVVSLEDIENNDYNLNISRYVDTTEEEEEVDIDKVIGEIRDIKVRLSENEDKLNGFLRELGFGEI
ncbi:type I restriction-modification system subunit M [Paraclostridium sordellii]|uniref:type I restriction-modification system subunit M n=1 Tax=Paraclostridium sordellii TaxID=1505 RepID=UPI0005E1268F|nr:type I restriction-modification system subunit M [Paeniclostridium sordellii]CEN81214.1 type I restriction system adenine methylase HsdM [[Clostridium] sordellii] [Paeniclostridium sordellii]